MEKLIERANIVIEALPYIKKYSGKTFVIKYGGNAMVDETLKAKVIQDMVLLKYVGINIVIVHGGGPELTQWLKKINKQTQFIDGLRVTDQETVELAEMVFVGKINKELVSLFHRHGGKAVGLSGRDGRLIHAEKITTDNGVDLGYVGDVKKIDAEIISTLLNSGFTPIISSIGEDENGQGFNINADTVACAVAAQLKASKLFLLTDVNGVLKEGKLISKLTTDTALGLIEEKVITGGMIPKIKCAIDSIQQGIEKVHIINGQIPHSLLLEVFTDHGIGTMVKK